MPKRVNNVFDSKLKFNLMVEAFHRAAKGKRQNKEVILYEMDLASNLVSILKDIYAGNYRLGMYRKFTIYEPKEREILALPFRDRVVHQWYVEEFIKPYFLPNFINDTYACIPERGLHKAVGTLRHYIRCEYNQNKNFYILKCDVAKFFYNINKSILFEIIERKIKDKKFLEFTKKLIFDGTGKVRIPIGNYTSQFFANIYLNELDHFVKENLNVKYYVRYMDDFILLLNSKQEAKETLRKIEKFLAERLELKLNQKTNYFKFSQGVTFCGYKVFLNKVYLSKVNKKAVYKRVKNWNKAFEKRKTRFRKGMGKFTILDRACKVCYQ
jgi:retron-type reverse transcriptase